MQITTRVALEVASHEAVIRQAYRDSVGVWTWSVGLTSSSGHEVERYIGKPQSMEKCLEVFIWALQRYAQDVREAFAPHILNEAEMGGALSFHWNTGAIKKASWVKHYKAGNIAKAKKAFMNWTKPKEITARRKKERDLFFSGKWSNTGAMTEYTKLTSRHTPVWKSAVRRDVRGIIERLLGKSKTAKPTSSAPTGLISALLAMLKAFLNSLGRKSK